MSGFKPVSSAQIRLCCNIALNLSGAFTPMALALNLAAALTYANRSLKALITSRSIASIASRISSILEHSSGAFIIRRFWQLIK